MTLRPDIIDELVGHWADGRQVQPFSERPQGFSLAEAYLVADGVRRRRTERGEKPVGRKIGFTNRQIWKDHGIAAPIWGTVYDSTLHHITEDQTFTLGTIPEPRIEPELVLHLGCRPEPGMGEAELSSCVDWVAPGFEIVFSIFPGWKFSAADTVAAFGVHRALYVGEPLPFSGTLPEFDVTLRGSGGIIRTGNARDVLGGPMKALHFLLHELQGNAGQPPIEAGETITTGTLTEAMPAVPGDRWTFACVGLGCPDISLRLA